MPETKIKDSDLKDAVKQITALKQTFASKQQEILQSVETKKRDYEDLCVLYRELFGSLPWDQLSTGKGKARGMEYMVVVEKDKQKHEIKGKGWSNFGDAIYDFLNTPHDLRNKVVWNGNWPGLRDLLLRAGYIIVSTNWG